MPTYEYECEACGHKFDEFQYFSEALLTKCPECKKKKLRRLFGTGASVIFKGSGFYETDYRSESYKSGAKADEDSQKPPSDDKASRESKPSDSSAKETAKAEKPASKGTAKSKAGKSGKGSATDHGASGK